MIKIFEFFCLPGLSLLALICKKPGVDPLNLVLNSTSTSALSRQSHTSRNDHQPSAKKANYYIHPDQAFVSV